MRWIYQLIFTKILGWKIIGSMPTDKKYIIIVAPHTSNWDFFVGLAVRSILKFKASYLGKKELFRPPFGWLFRRLGGYPVDRSKHTNLVDAVVDIFNAHDSFSIAIAPEGTRKYVPQWKTGFYYMALKANVPMVFAAFDYKRREVVISTPYKPTGDKQADEKVILSFFRNYQGRYPKKLPEKLF